MPGTPPAAAAFEVRRTMHARENAPSTNTLHASQEVFGGTRPIRRRRQVLRAHIRSPLSSPFIPRRAHTASNAGPVILSLMLHAHDPSDQLFLSFAQKVCLHSWQMNLGRLSLIGVCPDEITGLRLLVA